MLIWLNYAYVNKLQLTEINFSINFFFKKVKTHSSK